MAKVKLSLKDKSDAELSAFAANHIVAMTGNANFATPNPTAPNFQTPLDTFNDALADVAAKEDAVRQAIAAKNDARVALEGVLNQRAGYVDSLSAGIEAKILTSGFLVRDAAAPVGELPAPVDFLATMGDLEGELDLTWSRVRGAKSYIVQKSPYATPRNWTQAAIVTKSKATVGGCPPGELCVFRVAAVGAAGQGAWSDESVKMSP